MSAPRFGFLSEPSGPVDPEWLGKGEWLSRAAQAFGHPDLIAQCNAAAERFKALGDGETVESFRLDAVAPSRDAARGLAGRLTGEQRTAWTLYTGLERVLWGYLRYQLQNQLLVALGSPERKWEAPVWIATARWSDLNIDPFKGDVACGTAGLFYSVRVMLLPVSDIPAEEVATVVAPRPAALPQGKVSAVEIQDFVASFVARVRSEGREPTALELEEKWQETGHRGYRKAVRDELIKQVGPIQVGRPSKTRRI
jgi:hypothetical protein